MIKTILIILSLVTAVLPFSGCSESSHTNTLTTPLITHPPDTDTLAPEFSLMDLDGNTVTLSEMIDKTIILNFWAIT